ncbi:MAG: CBS domain-containing protein [Candidatus Marinimicrobia bacterium]|nr:CBS domain-containing protein [Candidatus Neomarinimicrobiota bacterium]
MIEYDEHIDDELKTMNEGESSIKKSATEAIHLDAPITTVKLRKPVTIAGETSVADCLELMREERIGCLLITENKQVVGIFTERDIIRRIVGKNLAHKDINVSDYMTSDPDTLTEDAPLAFALNYMVLGGYRHVPIVDENNSPVACLSIKDVIKHIGNHYFSEIVNLPPTPKNPGWATVDGG